MKKLTVYSLFFVMGLFCLQAWAGAGVPEPFRGYDENSRVVISYADLDSLLDAVVLHTGRSDRKKASPRKASTGTRMKFSINRSTVNEGNRFYYEVFEQSEENRRTLSAIRRRLENLPSYSPLEKFNRDEQLAYWINLYNVTILDEIIRVYPVRDLEEMLSGEDSILEKKILEVAGIPLSLNDIQFTILKHNYNKDPLVIYGLYQGIIGGPNIRKGAYTGKFVYGDLIDNAVEFINSNRGTEAKSRKVFRVSSYYARNSTFFEDFETDLTAHLLTYLEGKEKSELAAAKTLQADINDWTVTDLFGNSRDLAGSFGSNSAALMGATSGGNSSRFTSKAPAVSRYSPEVVEHLKALNSKREQEKTGNVTIEEMGDVGDDNGG
jgi:hypothetical protein